MSHDSPPFDPALFAEVRRPLAEASTLPAWCYSDAAFFAREQDRIFKPAWRFAGRADELTEPGDFLTLDTAGGPVFLLRGEDGRLRAFANSCRHRGAQLLEGRGRCPAIVCPYHAWSYGLDGSLKGAPGMAEVMNFDKADFGLTSLRLESWAGFVFISTDAAGPSLADHLGDMPKRFASHAPEQMRCVRRVTFDIKANWKLLTENAMEAYHTGPVHRTTLGQQAAELLETDGDWLALRVLDEASIATLKGEAAAFPEIEGLTDEARFGTTFTMILPATQFVFAPDCMWWLDFQPLGPARTRLELGSCFPETTVARPDFAQAVVAYYRRWDLATPEDNAICEAQQRGLASALRRPGRYAAAERHVHSLNNWVLDRVLEKGPHA